MSSPERAHQSLYRTHRPHTFADVVGQDAIVKALEAQVASGAPNHAYLFSGSRGLGKTSIARIFAKELGTSPNDLYEIDAASNNSVDGIRALSENTYTLPFESPHKVYILDEAHMLSKGAWNAFLKTLEEPPAHAIFILATTELSKVPDTVQSRCQVFEFKKPTREGLAAHINAIAAKEGYTLAPTVPELISMLADGSYRDALSILQNVLSQGSGKTVSRAEAEAATGAPRRALVISLVQALHEGNADSALRAISEIGKEEVSAPLFLTLLLEELRTILLIRTAPTLRDSIAKELGADAYKDAELIALESNSKISHATLKTFLEAASRMRFAPIPLLALELAVYELGS